MRKQNYSFGLKSLAIATALTLSTGGLSVTNAQESTLEEIVVTAQFRKQNLQQTPIAITAVNSETLEARSQNSIEQVAAQAPSVTLAPRGAAYGPSMAVSIRGVGQADFNPAFEPGVGLYVDDVYYPTLTGSIIDLLDLDRVEISRGPQGTLAGRNSIGGSVKMYSRTPAGDDSGYASITYGSGHRVDVRASADFALTDNLFARISGVSKQQDGYVDRIDYGCAFPSSGIPRNMSNRTNCVQAKEGEINYDAIRTILHWDNGGSVTVTSIADYTIDDRVTGASVLIAANPAVATNADIDPWGTGLTIADFVPPKESYYNYAGYTQVETDNRPSRFTEGRSYFEGWGFSTKVNWEISDILGFESITAYREYESGFSNDNDLSPLNQQIGDGTLPFWSISQELRLNGTSGEIDWTVGAFFMNQRSTYASYQDLRYSVLPPFQQDDPVDAESTAVFAHMDMPLSDELSLVFGLRYTDESKDYQYVREAPDGGPVAIVGPLNGVVGTYSDDNTDYRLGLNYQVTDNIMTYAQVSTGFKGGGINPRPFFAVQAEGFGTETLTSFEIGAKSELLDRTLRLNGAIFLSDYEDIQTGATTCPAEFLPPGGGPCSLILNAGTAEVTGLELEANFQPSDSLLIDASMSYLDFEYTEVSALAQGGAISPGNTAPFTPELKWSLGAQYTFFLDGDRTLTPRFDASFNDEVFTTSSNNEISKIDSYMLVNTRLTWRDEGRGWEAALAVTNLTEEYYFRSTYDAYARAGLVYGTPGRPREWAMTIKKNF